MPLSSSTLTRLQYQHETIAELITGFNEEQLKFRVNPDKWSAFENIVHLVSYQPVFIYRIGLMLKENNPLFERYAAGNDPLFHDYLQRPLKELLDILVHDRSLLNRMLSEMDEEKLKRTGLHSKFGNFTLSQWANLFLLHEAHHLWTILQLLSASNSR
jgi:hypothetical protein